MKRSVKNFFLSGLAASLSILTAPAQTAVNFGSLPLGFEASPSEADGIIGYTAHGAGSQFSVSPTGAKFSLLKKDGTRATVNMEFIGANPAAHLSGEAPLPGKVNYLVGNDPALWRSGVSTVERVRCEGVYPGVSVVYYGNQNQLEYDFNLAAGVDPNTISFRLQGAENISIDSQGELVIRVNGGKIIQHTPEIYQNVGGLRHELTGGYKLLNRDTVAFAVGQHDPRLPLVIDPILGYSTYFGGSLGDFPWAAKVDGASNLYIAGWTFSIVLSNNVGFATPGAYQTSYQHGPYLGDGFVSKFDYRGSNEWTTYLGGANGDNVVTSLALDGRSHIFVTGYTTSTSFPTTNTYGSATVPGPHISGTFDSYLNEYRSDAFVSELSNDGSKLLYSTYLGGTAQDAGYGIAVDSNTNIYVAGITYSVDFPTTKGALFSQLQCSNTVYYNNNAFVTEIADGGTKLTYSTFWGGTNVDAATALAYTNGYLVIAGYTSSTNFYTTNVVKNQVLSTNNFYFQGSALNGSTNLANYPYDAFVTCFKNTNTSLVPLYSPLYSTYLGGTNNDFAWGVAADGNGNAYVVGSTTSTNFPFFNGTNGFTFDSYVRTNLFGGVISTNSFLTQILWNNGAATNASIGYSAMFGGLGIDVASAVALAPDGKVFVVGSASSTNFPVTPNNLYGNLSPTNNNYFLGYLDAYVMAFASNAPTLLYSAYIGGIHSDFGLAVAVDDADNAYVVGQTHSVNFPTFNAFQSFMNGTNDVFLTKVLMSPAPQLVENLSTNLQISWPLYGQIPTNQVVLQTITNLLSNNWASVTEIPMLNTNTVPATYVYTFSPTNHMQFFRLQKLF